MDQVFIEIHRKRMHNDLSNLFNRCKWNESDKHTIPCGVDKYFETVKIGTNKYLKQKSKYR